MRAVPPLLTRILGYGGALVLVAVAVTVVLLQLQADVPGRSAAGSTPSASAPGAAGSGGPLGATSPQGVPGGTAGTGATPGALGTAAAPGIPGSTRCGSAAASYQRAGDSVKVSVTVPATGLVAAFVEAKGRGTLTKSVTAGGEQGPHVFEFTGVPAAITRRIGITVITQSGLQTCDLPTGG